MEEYSVSVRLRRVITETAHVSVVITPDLIRVDAGDPGNGTLNAEMIFQAALKQGTQDSTNWVLEGDVLMELHPTQTPPPEV